MWVDETKVPRCELCSKRQDPGNVFPNWKHPEYEYNKPFEHWCSAFTKFDVELGFASYWYVGPDDYCCWGDGR